MTNAENLRITELSKMHLESLAGYDGHSMHPGLPRHLAQEYDSLRAKRDLETSDDKPNNVSNG